MLFRSNDEEIYHEESFANYGKREPSQYNEEEACAKGCECGIKGLEQGSGQRESHGTEQPDTWIDMMNEGIARCKRFFKRHRYSLVPGIRGVFDKRISNLKQDEKLK